MHFVFLLALHEHFINFSPRNHWVCQPATFRPSGQPGQPGHEAACGTKSSSLEHLPWKLRIKWLVYKIQDPDTCYVSTYSIYLQNWTIQRGKCMNLSSVFLGIRLKLPRFVFYIFTPKIVEMVYFDQYLWLHGDTSPGKSDSLQLQQFPQ